MTTIACDKRQMAADSFFSIDEAGPGGFSTQKIYRIGKSLFGEAGVTDGSSKVIKWLMRGRRHDSEPAFEETEKDAFLVLELAPDGIFIWDQALYRYPVQTPVMAIGSGRKVALYCMQELEMSPADAVHEACKVDDASRPPIVVVNLVAADKKSKPAVRVRH